MLQIYKDKPVVVAMSGGVDSAMAALLLKQAGANVIGISMQVWDYRNHGGSSSRATCCAPADFNDAREVANKFDFPYYVFDFEDSFKESVIEPFVDSYLKGKTPNPCLECNRKVKFFQLRKRALGLGSSVVATGHYAQIKKLQGEELGLFTGKDKSKDQSYFLYNLKKEELKNTIFPVGNLLKPEVRASLAENGLRFAEKAESQDICFVSGSVGEFIESQTNQKVETGKIVNSSGHEIGQHQGVYNYTVGQRKGLGISNPSPLYVLNIDSESNTVSVGEKNELEKTSFYVEDINLFTSPDELESKFNNEVLVKVRYRHPGIRAKIKLFEENGTSLAKLEFIDETAVISPGQAAVFYNQEEDSDGDRMVLGGGKIIGAELN